MQRQERKEGRLDKRGEQERNGEKLGTRCLVGEQMRALTTALKCAAGKGTNQTVVIKTV